MTKYGISKRQYPDLDIENLTWDGAKAIIERDFWLRYRVNDVQSSTVALQVILLMIHMNPLKAGRIIQTAINVCGQRIIKVNVDGVVGSKTIAAINSLAPRWITDRIRLEAIRYYLALVDGDPSQRGNFRGWVRRVIREY